MSLAVPAAPLCLPVACALPHVHKLSPPQVKAFPSLLQTAFCFATSLCGRNQVHFDCPAVVKNAWAETSELACAYRPNGWARVPAAGFSR